MKIVSLKTELINKPKSFVSMRGPLVSAYFCHDPVALSQTPAKAASLWT